MAANDTLKAPDLVKPPKQRLEELIAKDIVKINDSIPVKRYFRSGREMLRMANVYLDEGNFERSFLLFMRYITLFIERLPLHCDYGAAEDSEIKYVKNNVVKIFPLAEELKGRIKSQYEKEYNQYLIKKETYELALEERRKNLLQQRQKQQTQITDNFVTNFQSQLDRKRLELSVGGVKDQNHHNDSDNVVDDDDKKQLLEDFCDEDGQTSRSPSPNPSQSSQSPVRPNKPAIDRSTKPSLNVTVKESKLKVIVPYNDLIRKFSQISSDNTGRNIETCAILCGKLNLSRFTITHLLVPKQNGTSDSCTSINEEDLACEQERLQLITLGWIHTHPTQRSFLSSIDLHTHALYQKMLPEAVAIVVAPAAQEIDIFSLTDHGLDYILQCRLTGFHPHANEKSLFTNATHIIEDDTLSIQVEDLR